MKVLDVERVIDIFRKLAGRTTHALPSGSWSLCGQSLSVFVCLSLADVHTFRPVPFCSVICFIDFSHSSTINWAMLWNIYQIGIQWFVRVWTRRHPQLVYTLICLIYLHCNTDTWWQTLKVLKQWTRYLSGSGAVEWTVICAVTCGSSSHRTLVALVR